MIFISSHWKKLLLIGLFIVLLSPQFFPSHAFAQNVDFSDVGERAQTLQNTLDCSWLSPRSWLPCGVLLPLSWFMGLFVSLGAALITYGLEMNAGLAYTSMVRDGFNVTLAIANLGFVFAIIVIALATIIGYESYGIKSNLWKLIAAALMVNFSLVICSVIIGFFDQFAYYFANNMGTVPASASAVGNTLKYSQVSLQLVNSFGLNKIAAGSAGGAAFKETLAFVPTLLFVLTALALIGFTLLAIAVNLIVRYIYLAILMILMPIAWLAWILPGLQKHWSSWWSNFIKWAINPTIILAFLYIAVQIMTSQSALINSWSTAVSGPGSAGNVFNSQTGGSGADGLFGKLMQMVVGLALVWGAIVAGNSLGARGTTMVMDIGKKSGKYMKSYGTRVAKRGATLPLRTDAGRRATQYVQTVGVNRNPVTNFLTTPIRWAGTAVSEGRQAGEKVLEESGKPYKDKSIIEQARQYGSASTLTGAKFAILMNVQKAYKASIELDKKAKLPKATKADVEAAAKAKAEIEQVLNVLPAKVKEDLLDYSDKRKPEGETRYGKVFRLSGEHEKKHEDKLKKVKELLADDHKKEGEHDEKPKEEKPHAEAPHEEPAGDAGHADAGHDTGHAHAA